MLEEVILCGHKYVHKSLFQGNNSWKVSAFGLMVHIQWDF